MNALYICFLHTGMHVYLHWYMQACICIGVTIHFNIIMNMTIGLRRSIHVNISIRIVIAVSGLTYTHMLVLLT